MKVRGIALQSETGSGQTKMEVGNGFPAFPTKISNSVRRGRTLIPFLPLWEWERDRRAGRANRVGGTPDAPLSLQA